MTPKCPSPYVPKAALALALACASCEPPKTPSAASTEVSHSGVSGTNADPAVPTPPSGPAAVEGTRGSAPTAGTAAPKGAKRAKMSIDEARRYMLVLINQDRASENLPPVELDEGAPTRSGQRHATDMAKNAFLGHWGSDGSVPEQRLTEAGGHDMVLENASCYTDEVARTIDPRPRIDPEDVERAESMFFHETPPNDGHRKNILKATHKRVGIGIAQPVATATEIPVPCIAQEFVDPYGTYGLLPKKAKVGDVIRVEGSVEAPAEFGGVGLARVETPKPVPVAELNRRRSYPVPTPYQMYWPQGFKTPIPVAVRAGRFSVEVPVSDAGKPGLYEVSVWAKFPPSKEYVMVGLRTLPVDPK